MISYTERTIFTSGDLELFEFAARAVALAPHLIEFQFAFDKARGASSATREVRCHEMARAVVDVLVLARINHLSFVPPLLSVIDGHCGPIEHSWICYTTREHAFTSARILDVYVPGRVPMVQLVDPFAAGKTYVQGLPRDDIRATDVRALVAAMRPVIASAIGRNHDDD